MRPMRVPQVHAGSTLLSALLLAAPGFAQVQSPSPAPPGVPAGPASAAGLFDLFPLDAWRRLGGPAHFELRPAAAGEAGPTLVGRGPIERNGFLASPRALGDFRLEVEVRLGSSEDPRGERMNSGIQIRSRELDGTVGGLQAEIDPTPRRWSGGIYDERGRGWLAPLRDRPEAQAAFRLGEWNRFEIECRGPRIRTKVNGIECAEWFDAGVSGLLAFQVHSGPACEVAFRAPKLFESGSHAWAKAPLAGDAAQDPRVALAETSAGVRMRLSHDASVRLLGEGDRLLAEVDVARGEATPARVEILWLEGRGAVLRDGVKVADLAIAAIPRSVEIRRRSADAHGSPTTPAPTPTPMPRPASFVSEVETLDLSSGAAAGASD